jgi:hypothetical protein
VAKHDLQETDRNVDWMAGSHVAAVAWNVFLWGERRTMTTDQADREDAPRTVKAKRGALMSDEAAAAMIEAHETGVDDEDAGPEDPVCECCGVRQATKSGVTAVNGRAYPNSKVCETCFIPIEDVGLPDDVDRDRFMEMHTDGPLTEDDVDNVTVSGAV